MKLSNKILIASDHGGFRLKRHIIEHLRNKAYEVHDMGTYSEESVDYPDYAKKLIDQILQERSAMGILICGSGIGMSIAANRHPKIRAALCYNALYGKLARSHNDANILVLGGRYIEKNIAIEVADTFLSTEFEAGRHTSRINKLR